MFDYPYMRAWLTGKDETFIDYQIKLARRAQAPTRSIYKSNVDVGVWVQVDEIFDDALRADIEAQGALIASRWRKHVKTYCEKALAYRDAGSKAEICYATLYRKAQQIVDYSTLDEFLRAFHHDTELGATREDVANAIMDIAEGKPVSSIVVKDAEGVFLTTI